MKKQIEEYRLQIQQCDEVLNDKSIKISKNCTRIQKVLLEEFVEVLEGAIKISPDLFEPLEKHIKERQDRGETISIESWAEDAIHEKMSNDTIRQKTPSKLA